MESPTFRPYTIAYLLGIQLLHTVEGLLTKRQQTVLFPKEITTITDHPNLLIF